MLFEQKFDEHKARQFFEDKLNYTESPHKLIKLIKNDIKDINIIDVREYDDYIDGHIPYAIHIPLNDIDNHLMMFEKDKINIVYSYCPYCLLGDYATHYVITKGFKAKLLLGGFKIWQKAGYDIVKTSSNVDK